jgi:hypothetical protein
MCNTTPRPRHHSLPGEAALAPTSPPPSLATTAGQEKRGREAPPPRLGGTYGGLIRGSMGPFRRSHSIQKSSTARRNPRAADLTDEIQRASFELLDDCPKKTLNYGRRLTSAISNQQGHRRGSGSGRRTEELPGYCSQERECEGEKARPCGVVCGADRSVRGSFGSSIIAGYLSIPRTAFFRHGNKPIFQLYPRLASWSHSSPSFHRSTPSLSAPLFTRILGSSAIIVGILRCVENSFCDFLVVCFLERERAGDQFMH